MKPKLFRRGLWLANRNSFWGEGGDRWPWFHKSAFSDLGGEAGVMIPTDISGVSSPSISSSGIKGGSESGEGGEVRKWEYRLPEPEPDELLEDDRCIGQEPNWAVGVSGGVMGAVKIWIGSGTPFLCMGGSWLGKGYPVMGVVAIGAGSKGSID